MSGAYRIEVSPNNRAACKNTECKKEGIKIQKGQLRYGTFITGPEWQSWAWKHWGCVTPKQISNLKGGIEGDADQLDGYDELPEEFQEKVVNALEKGHIDDEDWGWDIEMNREGKNGYLTLESKRRLKAEAQALKEEAAGEGSASPGKTDDKKRGHIKDDPDVEGTTEGEPPAKKTKAKAKAKKEPKIKNEDTDGGPEKDGPTIKETKTRIKKEPEFKKEDADGGPENDGPTIKETKSRIKKESKIKEDADGGPENDGPTIKETKSRIKKESKIKKEDADGGPENDGPTIKETKPRIKKEPKIKNEDADTRFGNDGSANKKTKAAFKKGKKANDAESDGDFEQNAQPVKKGHKRAKRAAAGEISALHSKDESSGHDVPSPPPAKKRRALRKAATAAIIKDEDTETDGLDSASEFETPLGNVKPEHKSELEAEASEGTPKLHKGRKGAPKKAVNETAGETNKEVKPKAIPAAPRTNGRVTRSRPA